MDAKDQVLQALTKLGTALGKNDLETAKENLNSAIAIIADGWSTDSRALTAADDGYIIPGLSGGCTKRPLAA